MLREAIIVAANSNIRQKDKIEHKIEVMRSC